MMSRLRFRRFTSSRNGFTASSIAVERLNGSWRNNAFLQIMNVSAEKHKRVDDDCTLSRFE